MTSRMSFQTKERVRISLWSMPRSIMRHLLCGISIFRKRYKQRMTFCHLTFSSSTFVSSSLPMSTGRIPNLLAFPPICNSITLSLQLSRLSLSPNLTHHRSWYHPHPKTKSLKFSTPRNTLLHPKHIWPHYYTCSITATVSTYTTCSCYKSSSNSPSMLYRNGVPQNPTANYRLQHGKLHASH
jgi:hypothetical protein